MEFANKLNYTQTQEIITKTYEIDIITVQWNKTEIYLSVAVFFISLFVVILVYCLHKPENLNDTDEVDQIDGPIRSRTHVENNAEQENSNEQESSRGCLDTSTLRTYAKKKKKQHKEKVPFDINGF